MGQGAGPVDGAGDGPGLSELNHLVAALSGGPDYGQGRDP